jgi:hypothetical protein
MRTMRVTLAAIITVALICEVAGLALAHDVDPMRPDVEPMGPTERGGASMFTMQQVAIEEVPWPEATTAPDGSLRWQGLTDRWTIESSDPRLSGTYTLFGNGAAWPLDEEGYVLATVMPGTVRIENEEGWWTGTSLSWMGVDPAAYYQVQGGGAYEGLTAIFHWVDVIVDETTDQGWAVYSGVVVPGPLPDHPEPPADRGMVHQ